MKQSKIIKIAFIDSISTIIYISLIVLLINSLQILQPKEYGIFPALAMLMLFVFSAAITGFFILGKPIMLYLDGKRKEAIQVFVWTLTIFFIIMLFVFLIFIFRVI